MAAESVGPGAVATAEPSGGVGCREPGQSGPPRPRSSGRMLDRSRDPADEFTIAGVGWRRIGPTQGLVVMARGRGSGRMAGSLARLTVVYGERSLQVTTPVGVVGAAAAGSLQTLRFVFRLPASAPSWPIDRLVLRFLGRNIELDPPVQALRAGWQVAGRPTGPRSVDFGSLRGNIDDVSTELLGLLTQVSVPSPRRTPGPTRPKAIPRPESEPDSSRRWLLSVATHLAQMANELSECRAEFDRISERLAARHVTVAEDEAREQSAEGEPPREQLSVEEVAAEEVPPEEVLPEEVLPEEVPPEEVAVEEPLGEKIAAPSPRELSEALAELRAELVRQALPEPDQQEPDSTQEAVAVSASLPGRLAHESRHSSWFGVALRRLAEHDLEAAGRVLVAVLPAQAMATPRYGRYDLILGDQTIFGVDARPLDTIVQKLEHPRPLSETGAWIMGNFEALGRLVLEGRRTVLSRLRRQAVKVKGKRRRLSDLLALVSAPLEIRDLCAVGARVPPDLLLAMIIQTARPPAVSRPVSIRVEPQEPGESRCTVIFDQSGARVLGATADASEATLVIRASSRGFMHLLAGLPPPEAETATIGSPEPLHVLQDCVRRLELATFDDKHTRRRRWRAPRKREALVASAAARWARVGVAPADPLSL